ncbi:MAG: glycosyltransferase family 4 protein [Planctomycetales bacterium]|nr:glycosyltransferase family 4 protein [Planctomycetales bacterium]
MSGLGYETLLVHGSLAPGEEPLTGVAEAEGAEMLHLPSLTPSIRPDSDAKALAQLVGVARRFRPDVIHTHTAKGGFLGRAAALALRPRPVVVHTFHGHVLEGYFSPRKTSVYRGLERMAAKVSDQLVGVSQATVDDLVRLRVAAPEKFKVIPLGLELDGFADLDPTPDLLSRRSLQIEEDGPLFTYVGRIATIKRLDVMLRAFAQAVGNGTPVRLAIVGDGEDRARLEQLARDLEIDSRVHFLGYRSDLEMVMAASDAVVLSSDNEGTPVSLIEAAASARPVVATGVGGVCDVVTSQTGIIVPPDDPMALAAGIATLAESPDLRLRMGAEARGHALNRFSVGRLIGDVDQLYRELLKSREASGSGRST